MVSCRNIMKLPQLKQLKLVAGEGGLDRIISWVHIVELPQADTWVTKGDLMLTTGISIKDENLLDLVKDISSKNLSGLIVNVGPYIKKIPKEVIDYANSVDFPIFELPFKVKFAEVTESICRAIFSNKIEDQNLVDFIKKIIYGEVEYNNEFLQTAILYGYDADSNYTTIVIKVDKYNSEQKYNIDKIMEKSINEIMYRFNKKMLYTCQNDLYIIIMPILDNMKEEVKLEIKELKNYISRDIPNIHMKIGCGRKYSKINELYKSFNQAVFALKYFKTSNKDDYMCFYDELGVYRIFYGVEDKEELKSIYNDILGELINYDLKKNSNLVETLKAYLEEDGNLNKVSNRLFVHRNTLKYRIQKIERIMNFNLKDANTRFNLFLAFKLKKFIES